MELLDDQLQQYDNYLDRINFTIIRLIYCKSIIIKKRNLFMFIYLRKRRLYDIINTFDKLLEFKRYFYVYIHIFFKF